MPICWCLVLGDALLCCELLCGCAVENGILTRCDGFLGRCNEAGVLVLFVLVVVVVIGF